MKKSSRFVIAAVLTSAGCLLLLSGSSHGGVLFGLATVFFMPRSELKRPISRRELWLTFGLLIALIVAIIAAKHFVTGSTSDVMERVIRHPAVVVPLWLLMLWGLLRHWQRQRGGIDAKPGCSRQGRDSASSDNRAPLARPA
jgi:hypothetical protein